MLDGVGNRLLRDPEQMRGRRVVVKLHDSGQSNPQRTWNIFSVLAASSANADMRALGFQRDRRKPACQQPWFG